jgi:hypothetical protein
MDKDNITKRLEYLREQIRQENISYSEIIELQSLAEFVSESDIKLMEWIKLEEEE